MGSFTQRIAKLARRAFSIVEGVAPSPPSDHAPAPDIDGRRPTETDPTRLKVDLERKDGHGGYR